MMNLFFIFAFIFCLFSYAFHTISHFLEYKGSKSKLLRLPHSVFEIIIFLGYISWGLMIAFDSFKINLSSDTALSLGLPIGLAGLFIFVSSVVAKKGFGEMDYLVTTGIYSKIRNPIYFGTILIHIGFPLAVRSLFTLASAIIWITLILFWKYWEEKYLEKKFGEEYIEYKKRTVF